MGDNPSAFPLNTSNSLQPGAFDPDPGMTLRDWFAGQALAGIGTWMPITSHADLTTDWAQQLRAEWAYRQADAMLAARTTPPAERNAR